MGQFANVLYQRSFSIDDRALETSRVGKSLAIETTLVKDIDSIEQCQAILLSLFSKLQLRLAKYADLEISKQRLIYN